MTKNKLKKFLVLEIWVVMCLEKFIKLLISFSFFDFFALTTMLFYLINRFVAYKNGKEPEWALTSDIIAVVFVNWLSIDEIIKLLF